MEKFTVTEQLYYEIGQMLGIKPDPVVETDVDPLRQMINYVPGSILDVPYYSQHGVDAQHFRKDCGPACVKMVVDYYWNNVGTSIDAIMEKITAGVDRGTYISELINAARDLWKVRLERRDNMTLAQLQAAVDAGYPVICLVNYGKCAIRMDRNYTSGHYVVVVGYDTINGNVTRVWVHDPDFYLAPTINQGAFLPLTYAHFYEMWSTCHENWKGNPDFMGLVATGVTND